MRALLALTALAASTAGCGGSAGDDCLVDSDCGGSFVCTRNAECLPPSEVRAVRVTWTVNGQPASTTTCAGSPSLYLMFFGTQLGDSFGYAPVPCDAGLFVIDKLPRRFVSVEIGEDGGFAMEKAFDAQGNADFDLP